MSRFKKWLENKKNNKVLMQHGKQYYCRKDKKLIDKDVYYLLDGDILLNLEEEKVRILHDSSQERIATELLLNINKFTKRSGDSREIFMVASGFNGLETTSLKIKRPVLDLAINYNDDLIPLHHKIIKSLKLKDKSGLYLFHGMPGTGKSTYIRYLIRSINKKVIFMPPGLAGSFDSVNIAKLLIENENTVFVIEDAEELLNSRESGRNSRCVFSMLLNLTDGLFGEALGIQVIVTFNTAPAKLDKALMRKGRLIALYEFKPLSVEKSAVLIQKSGIYDYPVHEPMTPADIYNVRDESFQFKSHTRNPIGFLSNAV